VRYVTTIRDKEYLVEIIDDRRVSVDGVEYQIDFSQISDQPVYSLLMDGQSLEAYVLPGESDWQVMILGWLYEAKVEDEREHRLRRATTNGVRTGSEYQLKAPMPGLVIAIGVEEGQAVKAGDLLLILESMKMQNELKSPRDGIVARVRVQAGDSVEQRQTLLSVV
jgi:acetyl/propionyl-CoA carboxylase alpha subunit